MTKKESNIMLFSIVLCWASAYIFIKDLPENLSSYAYLTITTGIASLIMLAVFHRSFLKLNGATLLRGSVLAILIAGTMLFEKKGLEYIPSSAASFLFTSTVIFVPIILLMFKKFPSKNNIVGILIILCGLFISNQESLSDNSLHGSVYILCSCAFMSLYTVLAAEFTKKSDPMLLSVLQMCLCTVIGFALWFSEDRSTFFSITWSKQMLSSIFILAFFSKAYAYIMLMYAQKYADAINVTVISATEPVITLLLAVLIPNSSGETETFSPENLIGALIIVFGAIVAGTNFLSKRRLKETSSPTIKASAEQPHSASRETPVAASLSSQRKTIRQFLFTMIPFAVLGAAFKVMVLIEGFTEVRPANAIPTVSGLLFGPIGALGCAIGNLIADFFGTFRPSSILGLIANFTAAYLPYRVWYSFTKKTPDVHSWKNLFLYLWSALIGSLSCAWILAFGLELFFDTRIDTMYKYVFLNNFGFSVFLGLPVFILVTSDSVTIPVYTPKANSKRPKLPRPVIIGVIVAQTAVLLAIALGTFINLYLENSIAMRILSIAAVLLSLCIFIFNGKDVKTNEQM